MTASVGIGIACGAINGALVVGLGVHPFIITLGTMWIVRGIAFVTSDAESILVPRALTNVAKASLGLRDALYPVPMVVMIVVAVVGGIYLMHTVGGRRVFAVGGNPEASRFSGVPIGRVKIAVFVLSGLTAGLAAFMGASFYGSASCADATGYELYVIASAVVGGASLSGGKGSAAGRAPGRRPDRAHPSVDPDPALRPELRVDHHRLRDYHRRRARSSQRTVHGQTSLCRREVAAETRDRAAARSRLSLLATGASEASAGRSWGWGPTTN